MNSPNSLQSYSPKESAEFSSLKDVTDILETETLILKKLHCIQVIVEKFMPDVEFDDLENDVFIYVFPAVNDLVHRIFERNLELLNSSDEKCSEVKDYLQIILEIFKIINNIVGSILKQQQHLQLQQIYSVPSILLHTLNSTFMHCKNHNHLYLFADAIQYIVSVFKSAQEVYQHLLQLLNERIELADEDLLLEILGIICDIGTLLIGINMKSMLETWKFYSTLTKKYSDILMDKINLEKPLKFVSNQISKNIAEIHNENSDEKLNFQTLNVTKFLMKLALKLFETYGTTWSNRLYWMEFFCSIFCHLDKEKKTFNLIEENVFEPMEFALFKFLANPNKLGSDELDVICVNRRGFMFLLCYVFAKPGCPNYEGFALKYLDIFLKVFTEDLDTDLRVNLINLFVVRILSVSCKEFMSIEELLFNNVLEGSTAIGLFASDIWVLLLRNAPPTLSYDTILNVISKMTLEKPTSPSLNQVKLCNLLRSLHENLPNGLKAKLLEKYSPEAHMYIWSVLGLEHLPAAKSFLKAASLNNFHKSIQNRDFTRSQKDFNTLIFSLNALANIAPSDDGLKTFESLKILWDFDCDLDEDYFALYVENLCLFTTRVLVALPAEHQSWVLGHMEKAVNFGPHMKIIIFRMLITIANKNMVPIAWKLVKLCSDDPCPIMKLYLDKAYAVFKSKVGGDNFDLSKMVCEEVKPEAIVSEEEEDEQVMETAAKRMRIEVDATQDALDLIQDQVKLLVKLQRQGKISREQSKQIHAICNKLQQFV